MADNVKVERKTSRVQKQYKKTNTIKKFRLPTKNSLRGVRRRRSKTRYYKSLKQRRYTRKTDDLCTAVQDFDIRDMDWAPTSDLAELPPEVIEWQKHEQIAYWKSRAICFELENRMLHEHLRNVYAKTIEERMQYTACVPVYNDNDEPETESEEQPRRRRNQVKKKTGNKDENVEVKVLVNPREPEEKNRLEIMKKIYGEEAVKIMGMETALQLNYERAVNQLKPSHWPTIPLRLSCD